MFTLVDFILCCCLVGVLLCTLVLYMEYWRTTTDDVNKQIVLCLFSLPFFPVIGLVQLVRMLVHKKKELFKKNNVIEIRDIRIKTLKQENTELKNQIEKMKCCGNCNSVFCNAEDKLNCGYNYDNWSLRT